MSLSSGRGDGRNRYGSGRRRQGRKLGGAKTPPVKDLGLEGSGAADKAAATVPSNTDLNPQTDRDKARADSTEKSEYDRAKDIVLRQLTMAARSRGQLEEKLRSKEISEDTVSEILDRYEDLGLVDDQQFAEMFVRSRSMSRKLARPALRRELAQKGVTGDIAEEALAQRSDDDEREDARELVRKKIKRNVDLSDRAVHEKELRRLASMLARRGYSSGMAFEVVKQELRGSADQYSDTGLDGGNTVDADFVSSEYEELP
ncbi:MULTISPECIES: regulatory protein RecX [Micrococcaceae]|uniref:regulatory protein RecX n=1 Tax=unclassified Kocuria TaxID=2649579 RepID=UPI001EE10A2E|nr:MULTISPECIES: regulatory protein RecX [unclassified Kocuria]